jgi:class 3 adenylate cyclase
VSFLSVQDAPGGATVTLVVENLGENNADNVAEQLQQSAKQLQAVQRYALQQVDMRQRIEHQLSQLKEEMFPILQDLVLQQHLLQQPSQTHYLTTLFLDMRGFSRLDEYQRSIFIRRLRGHAHAILEEGGAKYMNTWGDAIVACFEDVNTGLMCAYQLVTVLHAAGIQTRIGMSQGKTSVRGNALTNRLDIEGDSVNFAARLEPLAEAGEVLITEELRYHPEVKQECFIFTRHERSLKKAVGDQQQGNVIECYSIELVEDSPK